MNTASPGLSSAARSTVWKAWVLAVALGAAGVCAATPGKTPAKPAPAATLVDINAAPASELAALPGITEAAAAKIVAGRPYGSKAQLVTRKLVDTATYDGIKARIVARQPFKDARKNAAALTPRQ